MKDKTINRNGIRSAQAATGVSPADFDLGSIQSRAVARAIVDHSERSKPRRSQYDEDALQIVSGDRMFLCGLKAEPISRQLKATAIYQHGERLETLPSDDDGDPGQWDKDPIDRLAELMQLAWQRAGSKVELPPKKVKWREPLLLLLAQQLLLGVFQAAWERQLPEMPFPVRVERDGDTFRMYYRQPSGQWEEKIDNHMRCLAKELKDLLQEENINA
jgi:hypothetical protein